MTLSRLSGMGSSLFMLRSDTMDQEWSSPPQWFTETEAVEKRGKRVRSRAWMGTVPPGTRGRVARLTQHMGGGYGVVIEWEMDEPVAPIPGVFRQMYPASVLRRVVRHRSVETEMDAAVYGMKVQEM